MSYKVGPSGSKVSVQLMKRSAGCCPLKMPLGTTATTSPRPTLDGGVGDVAMNGSILGQLTRIVWLCGDCGVPLAAAVLAPAKTATMATAKLIRILRTVNPPLARAGGPDVGRRSPRLLGALYTCNTWLSSPHTGLVRARCSVPDRSSARAQARTKRRKGPQPDRRLVRTDRRVARRWDRQQSG